MIGLLSCTPPSETTPPDPVVEVTLETGPDSAPQDSDSAWDSTPDSEPPDSEAIVCRGSKDDDVHIDSLHDLEALEGIVVVEGDLVIQEVEDAGNLWHLRCLEEVQGSLVIRYNPHFLNLYGLESLHTVGRGVIISDNDAMTRLELPALELIDLNAYIEDLPALEVLSLPALRHANQLDIEDAPAHTLDLTSLESTSLDLHDLQITDLSGLASFRGGSMTLFATELTSLEGLPDGGVFSSIQIADAPGLTSLESMPDIYVSTSLTLRSLGIQDLNGLHRTASAGLNLYENEHLSSLDGMGDVRLGALYISTAPQLTSLAGLEDITHATAVKVHHTQVTTLEALSGLEEVSTLSFENNPALDLSPLGEVELNYLTLTDQEVSGTLADDDFATLWTDGASGTLTWSATTGDRVTLRDGSIEVELSQLQTLTNDLSLSGQSAWPDLSSVEAVVDITVEDAELLDAVSLPAVRTAQVVDIESTDLVETIDLGALESATSVRISGTGATSIDLGALHTVDSVELRASQDVVELDLGALTDVAELDLLSLGLTDLSGLALERVDDLTLNGLTELTSLTGLEGLESVSDTFYGRSLDSLPDFTGLGAVEIGTLELYQCDGLTSTDGLEQATISDELYLVSLPNLERVSGLDAVTQVDDVNISSNDALTSIDGLEDLASVGNDLTLYNNPDLTSIDGLFGLESVGRNFKIKDNTSLSTTDAEALRDAIGTANIGGTITISGNGS